MGAAEQSMLLSCRHHAMCRDESSFSPFSSERDSCPWFRHGRLRSRTPSGQSARPRADAVRCDLRRSSRPSSAAHGGTRLTVRCTDGFCQAPSAGPVMMPSAPAAEAASSVPGWLAWPPQKQRRKVPPGRVAVPACSVAISTTSGHRQPRSTCAMYRSWVSRPARNEAVASDIERV
jgi:hypothetical protein